MSQTQNNGIIYRIGDMFKEIDWDTPGIRLIPHCCNNIDGYAAGFAAAVSRKWPIAKQRYHEWYRLGIDFQSGKPFKLGEYQSVRVHGHDPFSQVFVLNMIGQDGVRGADNPKPVKYDALGKCINEIGKSLSHYSRRHENVHPVEIITVKFGSDLAGGDWQILEEMICDHWQNTTKVTVFSLS